VYTYLHFFRCYTESTTLICCVFIFIYLGLNKFNFLNFMWTSEELIVSIQFIESEDYSERVYNSLDIILKDLFSKWLLEDEKTWRRVSKEN
jgi:hypothetical protein